MNPNRKFEVFNAGINGFTSFLILKALQQKIIDYHPDIITINCRFNDSTLQPRWFKRFPTLTDRNSWERINILATNEMLHMVKSNLNKSYFYQGLKSILLNRSYKPRRKDTNRRIPRATPEEFRRNIGEIIDFAKKHHTRVILIPEPHQYCDDLETEMQKNTYIQILVEEANSRKSPYVDLFTPMQSRKNDFLFVDFIHPSVVGHEVIGKVIAEKINSLDWF